jgi:hypothetical protein
VKAGVGRALGLALVMIGVGLRLDSAWQASAWVFLAVGSAATIWGLGGGAFVRRDERE